MNKNQNKPYNVDFSLIDDTLKAGTQTEGKTMPLFAYIIRDKLKKILKGTAEAYSEEELRKRFRKQGYLVFSINKINTADTSRKNKTFLNGFELSKLLMILLLISGSYFLIKFTNRLVKKFNKKESAAKIETIPKEIPVIEMPEIVIKEYISQPKQDIVVDKVAPRPKPEQKEGVVSITLKREARKPPNKKALANYNQAQKYYTEALKDPHSKNANSYLRKAINYAQKALKAREGVEKEIRAFIRDCRKMLRTR